MTIQAESQNSNDFLQKIVQELTVFSSLPSYTLAFSPNPILASFPVELDSQEILPKIESYFAEVFPHLHLVNFKTKYNTDTKKYELKIILDIFNIRTNKDGKELLPSLNKTLTADSVKELAKIAVQTVRDYMLDCVFSLFKSLNSTVLE